MLVHSCQMWPQRLPLLMKPSNASRPHSYTYFLNWTAAWRMLMCSRSQIWQVRRFSLRVFYVCFHYLTRNSLLAVDHHWSLFSCGSFRSCVFADGHRGSLELCRELHCDSTGREFVCGQNTRREHGNMLPGLADPSPCVQTHHDSVLLPRHHPHLTGNHIF